MKNVQNLIIGAFREGTMVTNREYPMVWEWNNTEEKEYSWLTNLAFAEYDAKLHDGYNYGMLPTHVVRAVFRDKWGNTNADVLHGTEVFVNVDVEAGTVTCVWEDVYECTEPVWDGLVGDGTIFVNSLPGGFGECYVQIECPFSE